MSIDDTFGPLTNYEDVAAFHERFGLTYDGPPQILSPEVVQFRVEFLEEELLEFKVSAISDDLPGMADALVDLVYIAMGTAYQMGLPWQQLWNEVQRANMSKVRATSADQSKRKSSLDVVKPEGWQGPDIQGVLNAAK
jgi:predicted HAD superfamily Cof-like phosphohydrolase